MYRFAVALLAFLPAASVAGEVAVLINDAAPGSYIVTVGADKSVTVNPIRVVRPGSGPTQPPPVVPGDPTAFEAEVERLTKDTLTKGGSPTTGAALSSVYSLVADEVAAGRVAPASAIPAVKAGTDLVMSKQADAAAWLPWRTAVGDALTTVLPAGTTKDQYAAAFRQVSNGLKRASGFAGDPRALLLRATAATLGGKALPESIRKDFGILDGIDFAKLIELIKLIMELLKLFGGLG